MTISTGIDMRRASRMEREKGRKSVREGHCNSRRTPARIGHPAALDRQSGVTRRLVLSHGVPCKRAGWSKAHLVPCPREVSRQIELLRVGTADPAWCINPSLAAAFAHPTVTGLLSIPFFALSARRVLASVRG